MPAVRDFFNSAVRTTSGHQGRVAVFFPPFFSDFDSQKLFSPLSQNCELLSIKNATQQVSAASGLVGISGAAEPSRVSEVVVLPLTLTGGDVARVGNQTTISLACSPNRNGG